jgi:TonB-dependent Receptor Plug Domain
MLQRRALAAGLLATTVLVGGLTTSHAQAPSPPPTPEPAAPVPAPGVPEPPAVPEAPPPAGEAIITELAPLLVSAPPPVSASSQLLIPGKDFELRPEGRPGDILRLIPGLIIAQHQGGGKAEQYFLRGFDADHGTDIAFFVDGLPVNLRSHAHGQGYADLHFVIPEVMQRVEGFKGAYFPEFGDFNVAGAVNFITRNVFEENTVLAAGGMFDQQRYLTLLSPTRDALKTLFAVEIYHNNGPFENPNNYQRYNAFAKASTTLADGMDLAVWASYYWAKWNGSGEIPLRAVTAGEITRFGSIDPSEGGQTQRFNFNADWRWRLSEAGTLAAHAYATYYQLNMFNNFTLFLNDEVNGDGINQRDSRFLGGFDTQYVHKLRPFGIDTAASVGFQYRIDTPHVVLAHQVSRRQLDRIQDVDIVEQSYSPFVKFDLTPLPWLRFMTGVRGDIFHYKVTDNLNDPATTASGTATKARPNYKANLILGPWADTEFFGNVGTGFHSNDARAVVFDPNLTALPTALTYEGGVRTKIIPRTELSATYWVINLASELVFVGDEGTTEAAGASHRKGWEFTARVQLLDWLTLSGSATVSQANFDNGDAIPLAPRMTALADLTARLPWGFSANFEMRHLSERWLTEDRSQVASGWTVFDLGLRYRYKMLDAFVTIQNIFNTEWREAQFYFTSRLPNEPSGGVADTHFTPGIPRSVMGGLALHF